jgi:hypothetical protein
MRRALLVAAVMVAALSFCGPAEAEIFQIGPSLTGGGWLPEPCESPGCAYRNDYGKAPEPGHPPVWMAPLSSGVIVRLNVVGATTPGQIRVRTMEGPGIGDGILATDGVFRNASPPIDIVPSAGVQTYQMSMPISGGEEVGLSMSEGASIGHLGGEGWFFRWDQDPPESGPLRFTDEVPGLVGFNVEVQPPPSFGQFVPLYGPAAGGTTVAVHGDNFGGASSVMFGGTPATSFTVESETTITAISPPSAGAGPVPISVTTVAGTASTSSRFDYEDPPAPLVCVVPKLRGRTLRGVKKRLGKTECELGSVKTRDGATPKTGRVFRQSPRAGSTRRFGEEISVTLKPRKPIRIRGARGSR